MHDLLRTKHTGVLFPVFSMRSEKDWGIGDIKTMERWFPNLKAMNLNLLQVLPMNEMPAGVNCPYTALSAFALDPVYISVEDLPELKDFPWLRDEIASEDFQKRLAELRAADKVNYEAVKFLKFSMMWKMWESFKGVHVDNNTPLWHEFEKYCAENASWLDDYADFRHLKDNYKWTSWTQWEPWFRDRDKGALTDMYNREWMQVTYFKYIQWSLHRQWTDARAVAKECGIRILGDLPFMVNQESADVWSRREEFDLTKEAGAPPDAFSADGQHWGLPAYNWTAQQGNDFAWWRAKVKHAASFYDFFRVDHMVGFFRTWVIPFDKNIKANFDILDPVAQRKRGHDFLVAVSGASDMLPVAEDLGVIPPYVGEVLAGLQIPGYKIMRWEQKKGVYTDPKDYFPISIATTSTHDMETMAEWWKTKTNNKERKAMWTMIAGKGVRMPSSYEKGKELLLKKLFSAASKLVVVPIQDITGSAVRINLPNSVGDHNWSYRYEETAESFLKNQAKLVKTIAKLAEARL